MINQTLISKGISGIETVQESIKYLSQEVFLPSIIFYWFFQFLFILIVGLLLVKQDKEKFWSIFFTTQLIGGIFLFFVFVFPTIPQLIDKIL